MIDGRAEADDFIQSLQILRRHDGHDLMLAAGERSGFVEDQRVHFRRLFEHRAMLNQQSQPR